MTFDTAFPQTAQTEQKTLSCSFSWSLENPQIYGNEIMDHNFGIYKFEGVFSLNANQI